MTRSEIEAAIRPLLNEASTLESKAKELRALAEDYETKLTEISGHNSRNSSDITLDSLFAAIRKKNGRAKDYADRLSVSVAHIEKLIEESKGRIYPDGRGWLKIKEELKAAA